MFSALKIDYSNNFWQKCLCDSEDINSDCWSGSCAECYNGNNKWMVDNEENQRSIKKSTDPKSLHLQLTSGFPHFQKYVKVKCIQESRFYLKVESDIAAMTKENKVELCTFDC